MDKELFFEKLFIDSKLQKDICSDMEIEIKDYRELSKVLGEERKDEIAEIKRIRTLFHNKKRLEGFEFPSFNAFYKWHQKQFNEQNGECYYCKTPESAIAELFEKKFYQRKRTTRGKHLEIERKDSNKNTYSNDNCVLACYFCNNDKSEFFSENEYLEYLKDRKSFFLKEIDRLNDN